MLRAGAVHPGARRRLARLGPGRSDVHRLRRRCCRHRARPLPSGDDPRADRPGLHAVACVELADQRAGAAFGQTPHRQHFCRARVLRQFRRGGQRGRAEARAPLCPRSRGRPEIPRDLDGEQLPRPHALDRDRRRAGQVRERLRTQSRGLHAHSVQRRRGARARIRRLRRRHLRRHPGAHAGRRRHASRHAGIPASRTPAVHRTRRAADLGRDPERHGTHGHAFLVHAEGHRSRHPDQREGIGRRLSDRRDAHDNRHRRRVHCRRARHDLRRQSARMRGRGRGLRRHQHHRGAGRRQGAARAVHGRVEGHQCAPPRIRRPARRRRVDRRRARSAVARKGDGRREGGRRRGLMLLVAGPDVIRIAPSLVISLDEILEGLARLESALNRALV